MTETRTVSIEEVRTLVAERQRYEDWLSALEAKRDATPVRVFERVQGDYVARRRDVMERLREHVGGLAAMASDFDTRVGALEAQLNTLEDERAEAMLRTEVGEFDADRWERVRQDVEAQIAQLGEQRTALLAEVDEVRTLLASARSEPEVLIDAAVAVEEPAPAITATTHADEAVAADGMGDIIADVVATEPLLVAGAGSAVEDQLIDGLGVDDTFGAVTTFPAEAPVDGIATGDGSASAEELAELDNALALFGGSPTAAPNGTPSGASPSLNGLDVFDDAELGDLRMSPPARSTATATPPASPNADAPAPAAPSREGFDELAFLRSVVDPSASSGVAASSASSDQQKTLRCTECGTMNLPTEWYCERCGGGVAAC